MYHKTFARFHSSVFTSLNFNNSWNFWTLCITYHCSKRIAVTFFVLIVACIFLFHFSALLTHKLTNETKTNVGVFRCSLFKSYKIPFRQITQKLPEPCGCSIIFPVLLNVVMINKGRPCVEISTALRLITDQYCISGENPPSRRTVLTLWEKFSRPSIMELKCDEPNQSGTL